jgi:hypothetical protein
MAGHGNLNDKNYWREQAPDHVSIPLAATGKIRKFFQWLIFRMACASATFEAP